MSERLKTEGLESRDESRASRAKRQTESGRLKVFRLKAVRRIGRAQRG